VREPTAREVGYFGHELFVLSAMIESFAEQGQIHGSGDWVTISKAILLSMSTNGTGAGERRWSDARGSLVILIPSNQGWWDQISEFKVDSNF